MNWLSTADMAAVFRVSVATLQRLRFDPKWPLKATKREGATTYWQPETVNRLFD
jgi:hypothetical protein